MKFVFAVLTLSLMASTTWARASVLKMSEAQKVLVETVQPGAYRQGDCNLAVENTSEGASVLLTKKGRMPILFPLFNENAGDVTINYRKAQLMTIMEVVFPAEGETTTLTVNFQRAEDSGYLMSVKIHEVGLDAGDRTISCDFTTR